METKTKVTIKDKYKGKKLKDTRYCKVDINKDVYRHKPVIIPNKNNKRGEV